MADSSCGWHPILPRSPVGVAGLTRNGEPRTRSHRHPPWCEQHPRRQTSHVGDSVPSLQMMFFSIGALSVEAPTPPTTKSSADASSAVASSFFAILA